MAVDPPGHLVTRRRNLHLLFAQKQVELGAMHLIMPRKCVGDYWRTTAGAGWVRNMPIKGDFRIPGPGVWVYRSRMLQLDYNKKGHGCLGRPGVGVEGEEENIVRKSPDLPTQAPSSRPYLILAGKVDH